MSALIDTCILLDFLLRRVPWHREARLLFRAHAAGAFTGCATTLSVANVHYISRRLVGRPKALHFAKQIDRRLGLVSIDATTVQRAFLLIGPDFEDNIQIAAAEEAQLDAIITRDPAGFAGSVIPVFTPADFVRQFVS